MKTRTTIITILLACLGIQAFAQLRGGSVGGARPSAPSGGGSMGMGQSGSGGSSSGNSGGGLFRGGMGQSTPSSTRPTSTPTASPDRGTSQGTTYSGSDRATTGSGSAPINSNNTINNNNNNTPMPATNGGWQGGNNMPINTNMPSNRSSESIRNEALADIRNTLSTFDKTSQRYTVSGTQPSTVQGAMGLKVNIDPSNLETVNGQPVTGDIEVELKELDSPEKMGLAGTPTMSNGEPLESAGSYYIGLSSGGSELRLRNGAEMTVELPMASQEPGMELFYGDEDRNGNVNWQPANTPLRSAVGVNSDNRGNTENGGSNGNSTPPSGPRASTGVNQGNRGNTTTTNPNQPMFTPITVNRAGWLNADKFMRGGSRYNVEVEGVDPLNTQVYLVYKNRTAMVEGQFDNSLMSNNFVFRNVPNNEEVKVVVVSKVYNTMYTGELKTVTRNRETVTVPVRVSSASEASTIFKY